MNGFWSFVRKLAWPRFFGCLPTWVPVWSLVMHSKPSSSSITPHSSTTRVSGGYGLNQLAYWNQRLRKIQFFGMRNLDERLLGFSPCSQIILVIGLNIPMPWEEGSPLSPSGTLEPPRGTHNAAAGDPWMDRWMDGGGTFMASVSRGQSHFAREHSKRWHTKNPRCLATWANFSCFWLLLITIGPKSIWTLILHFLSFWNCTSYVLSGDFFLLFF